MRDVNSTTSDQVPSRNMLISLIVFKCLVFIAGVLGNAVVIIYNVFLNHSKTPTSCFVVNLAIIDLLACCSFYPTWITEIALILIGIESDQDLFCRIVDTSSYTCITLSILSLVGITVDKFIFISKPFKYKLIVTWRRTYYILLLIWCSAMIYAPFLVIYTKPDDFRLFCVADVHVAVIGVCFYVFIPTIFIVILNYKMFKIARQHVCKIATNTVSCHSSNSTISRWRIARELRVIKTFAIVIGVFLFLVLTGAISLMLINLWCASMASACIPPIIVVIFIELLALNSIVNPFIYGFRQKEYRVAFRRLFSI